MHPIPIGCLDRVNNVPVNALLRGDPPPLNPAERDLRDWIRNVPHWPLRERIQTGVWHVDPWVLKPRVRLRSGSGFDDVTPRRHVANRHPVKIPSEVPWISGGKATVEWPVVVHYPTEYSRGRRERIKAGVERGFDASRSYFVFVLTEKQHCLYSPSIPWNSMK